MAAAALPSATSATSAIQSFLCGDPMWGRGIDQILPHPSDPPLHEPAAQSALDYPVLAETAHGAIAQPVPLASTGITEQTAGPIILRRSR
ncbi:MAG TPA: hypothetical protein PKC22_05150 [Rhodocyclaceae bacterium]|nr:hypothetical protein [Rhodocyclaceae bacterium]